MATALELPRTVLVDVDMRYGRKMGEYVLRCFKDTHGPDRSDPFEVWDYRPESDRTTGSLASLEGVSDERLILRPAQRKAAELKLVLASYTTEGDWGGLISRRTPHWQAHFTSRTKSGQVAGGKVLALVDDGNPLLVFQGHLIVEYGFTATSLERHTQKIGQFVPVLRLPDGAETGDVFAEAEAQGLKYYTGFGGSSIYPEPCSDGWVFPQQMGASLLHLAGAEAGGQIGDGGGCAIVITNAKGHRLRIFHTGDPEYELRCGTHAWFSEPGQLVSVTVDWQGDKYYCLIHRYMLAVAADTIRIQRSTLWSGTPDSLPAEMEPFRDAVKAALVKVAIRNCTEIIYAQDVRPV